MPVLAPAPRAVIETPVPESPALLAVRALLGERAARRPRATGTITVGERVVLDEHALGAPQPCFDRFMRAAFATEETAAAFRSAGVQAEFGATGAMTISLASQAVISFSTLACDTEDLTLRVPGKDVTIVTTDGARARVITDGMGAKGGDVTLVMTQGERPRVRATGDTGPKGVDAACPDGFSGCLADGGARQPAPSASMEKTYDRTEERLVGAAERIPGTSGEYVAKLQLVIPPLSKNATPADLPVLSKVCRKEVTPVGAPRIRKEGQLRIESRIAKPRWAGGSRLDGADGFAVAPGDGSAGFPGGSFHGVFAILQDGWKSALELAGGAGGAAGRGGLVDAAPGVPGTSGTETVDEIVHAHTFKATVTHRYRYRAWMKWGADAGACDFGLVDREAEESHAITLRLGSAAARSFEGGVVALPGGSTGRTPARPLGVAGGAGPVGRANGGAAGSVQALLDAIPAVVAMPASFVGDVEALWAKGAFELNP